MDDLAEELGMSKKTLYAAFPGKAALLRAVLLEKFRSVETDLEPSWRDAQPMLGALHQLLACMQHHTEEIQPPFVRDIRREAPEIFKLVESGAANHSALFRQNLRRGRAQGSSAKIFPPIDDRDFVQRGASDHESAEDGRARSQAKTGYSAITNARGAADGEGQGEKDKATARVDRRVRR